MNLGRFVRQQLDLEPRCPEGKPDAPQPPNYVAASREQGAQNINAAVASGVMGHPDQVNPLGSQSWSQTGSYTLPDGTSIPTFTGTTSLSQQGQQLFDKDMSLKTGLMDLGGTSLQNAQNTLSQPFDPSKNRDAIVDAMYNRQKRLLDPYYKEQDESQEAKLIAKGFSVGNEGYDRANATFQRGKDNAYMDAMDRASTGGAQQAIQEALISRNQPLNELNAIRTGAQPGMPQFGAQPQGNVAPAPIMAGTQAAGNAALGNYGIQAGNYNSTMGGLGNLGAAYMLGSGGLGTAGAGLGTDAALTGAADAFPAWAALAFA